MPPPIKQTKSVLASLAGPAVMLTSPGQSRLWLQSDDDFKAEQEEAFKILGRVARIISRSLHGENEHVNRIPAWVTKRDNEWPRRHPGFYPGRNFEYVHEANTEPIADHDMLMLLAQAPRLILSVPGQVDKKKAATVTYAGDGLPGAAGLPYTDEQWTSGAREKYPVANLLPFTIRSVSRCRLENGEADVKALSEEAGTDIVVAIAIFLVGFHCYIYSSEFHPKSDDATWWNAGQQLEWPWYQNWAKDWLKYMVHEHGPKYRRLLSQH